MPFIKISHLVTGLIAVLVGYTSSVAIIFQAAEAAGVNDAQANSWMLALGLGMGISGLILSLRYRMPILTAWSTPGAALMVVALPGVGIEYATGAFVFSAILLTLTGVTGWFERLSRIIPDGIASAMLAGILFQFGLSVFTSMQTDLTLVSVMCITYLAARMLLPRFAIPVVLVAGIAFAWISGNFDAGQTVALEFARPEFVMPAFSIPVLISVGLPLYIVTMTSQNMPGVVTLKTLGYEPPVSAALTVTGLTTLVLAPFGGYAFNLAAITAAICAGPEADENPKTRYRAVIVAGVLYCLVGLFGATIIALFALAPTALVVTIAGLALLGTIGNSLAVAVADDRQREAALVTFLTTVSGISFFDIGSAVWGLLFGAAVYVVQARKTA